MFEDISTPTDEPKEKFEESESTSSEKISRDEKSETNEETTELENSLEESEVYTPTHVDEIKSSSENVANKPIKTDLKTILAEDMAMIRGSSREKIFFVKM